MMSAGTPTDREDLAARLGAHLSAHFGRTAEIRGLSRLTGGTSNDTWAFDACLAGPPEELLPLVLRRSFATGPVDMGLETEFEIIAALHRQGLPVPKPYTCAAAPSPLATPFMVVGRAAGTDLRKVLARDAGRLPRSEIGRSLVAVQVRIHEMDWQAALRHTLPPVAANGALAETEKWAPAIESDEGAAHPLLLAALDWLRANAPGNGRICLVHGDFKANNLLFGDGALSAVIDWEMAHLGDPLEDLAWTLLWRTGDDLVNGLLPPDDYIDAYEAASARSVDRERLFFWRIFAHMKLAAMFLRGLRTGPEAAFVRPTNALLGRSIPYLERQLADFLLMAQHRRAAP